MSELKENKLHACTRHWHSVTNQAWELQKVIWAYIKGVHSSYRTGSCFKQSHHGFASKIQLPLPKILLLGAPTLKYCSQMDFKGTHNNGKDLLTH